MLASSMALAGGTIRGKLLDKESKDPLPGANVVVKGTSLGTSTDIDGAYVIYNVPAGAQTVIGSYVGYLSLSVTINVTENSDITQNFYLKSTEIEGEAVVVTGQAQGQLQAINQQISSNKIANIVSEEKIQELPDFNAAQAIGRLPGVSTTKNQGEDNKIVIRGLAPQFNAVAVGGITLASTGSTQIGATSTGLTSGTMSNDRSVDLTMVTPYMIKSIEVYKSLTPDMEANAIGGYVNMELREAPSGLRTNVLFQEGYTEKSNTYGNYRAVVSASDRFFGDKIGVYVLANAEQYDRSADNMNAGYQTANSLVDSTGFRQVRVTNVTLDRHVETRNRYGANVILDYMLPFGSIKSVNMFSREREDYTDYSELLNYASPNYDIDFRYRQGINTNDVAVNSLEFTNDFKLFSVDIKAANSYSRNAQPLSPYYTFFQNGGISHTNVPTGHINILPENLVHFLTPQPDSTTLLGSTSMFSAAYQENDQIYKGDFKVPMNISSFLSGFFKFGGEYRYNLQKNDQSTPYISINKGNSTNRDINYTVAQAINALWPNLRYASTGQLEGANFTNSESKLYNSFLSNKFGSMYWATNPTILNGMMNYIMNNAALQATNSVGGWFNGPYQNLPNDYKYSEKYTAGYLMGELDVSQQFMIVGGARYEEVHGLFDAYNMEDERNPAIQPYRKVSASMWNHFWLPQVQAKYSFGNWADLRYSYTQTLARPDYTQLDPHYNISADSPRNIYSGNPNLVPAQAYNHDVLLSLHSNDLGLLTIGGFYKEIKNFTYATSYHLHSQAVYNKFGITGLDSVTSFPELSPVTDDDAVLNTFVNSQYIAYVKGLEVDLQTRLWYLPAPFNGIVLGINYTHVWSRAIYPYYDENALRGVITKFTDSTRVGRLIDQPNDILNSYVGYDYKGFSAKVTFTFQGNSVTYVGAYPETDGFSKDYFSVGFSARQMLPWTGLSIFFDANNLNSESNISTQPSIGGFTSENFYGMTLNLGIRYEL
ncbi:MAG TPA: TonB-dependent receptor [Bacteroidota bacterium]|nr:TonB-dependent receptor [Bacteroidota bacterium]